MKRIKASKIRKEICLLKAQRDCLEISALRHRIMIDVCLIKRYLEAGYAGLLSFPED